MLLKCVMLKEIGNCPQNNTPKHPGKATKPFFIKSLFRGSGRWVAAVGRSAPMGMFFEKTGAKGSFFSIGQPWNSRSPWRINGALTTPLSGDSTVKIPHSKINALVSSVLICLIAAAANCHGQETRMTPELLWKLGRLGNPALSEDGDQVAYTVRRYDLKENSGTTTLYVKELESGKQRPLLSDWKSISDVQFAASPFGERIYFTGRSGKQQDEKSQVWAVNPLDGGVYQVTSLSDEDFENDDDDSDGDHDNGSDNGSDGDSDSEEVDAQDSDDAEFSGVANLKVAPTGKQIAFTMDVKLDDTVNDLYDDLPKADARIIDSLMFRHWNAWHDYKYTHLHVAAIGEDGRAAAPIDMMEGQKVDCPVPPFAGAEQFAWSPDGRQIAYTAKNVKDWAESTDSDVYIVELSDPSSAKNITEGMDGYDNDPSYSPDGKWLAFHSMKRPGFEADRNRIMIYDRGTGDITDATLGLDQTAHGALWVPDSSSLIFTSEHQGTVQIYRVKPTGGGAKPISSGRFNWSMYDLFPQGDKALVAFRNMLRPNELAIMSLTDGTTETITGVNDGIYEHLELPTIEERWIEATDGKKIHTWVIYPPDFDENKKWPMLTYCQGGPQGQVGQWFSFRWNFHLMAANGYVIAAPNRRGLPGFGREWNDQISRDWGGQAMQDLLSVTDTMSALDFIDKKRVAAIGASFGGYTVYWLMGNAGERFACMLAHCGVFNLESMYGSTEELFFPNWDLGGPYWKGGDIQKEYDRFSPHRYVKKWKTPLLVVHGQMDFRVPVTQGMEAFTAAQVQGVPSRFLYFPNEGHWVLGPQNGVLWHRVFFEWLDKYCK
jgi:dipeptidyl aminopeptidase/acylaminoacyl peptidase